MAYKKSNIHEEMLEGHRHSNCLTSKDYGTIAFLIDKKDILKDKKANAESFKETELTHNCIYFLIGYEDEGENSVEKMYVGQAGIRENGQSVLDRLNEHIYTDRDPIKYRNKWSDIVVVTNRDRDAWGATELNALEHIFWSAL